jgi:hypothetical protein
LLILAACPLIHLFCHGGHRGHGGHGRPSQQRPPGHRGPPPVDGAADATGDQADGIHRHEGNRP